MNKKLKCWACSYGGITQVYAAETKSRARYTAARALVAAGWVDSTHAALVKLRSWRMPEFDAAAQELGREGAVQYSADLKKPPAARDQELRDQLALTEGRLATLRRIVDGVVAALPYYDEHEHDAATAVKMLVADLVETRIKADALNVALYRAHDRTARWKDRAVGWMKLSRHCATAVVSRAEIADIEQAMLQAKVDKINMALYDARERAERWKTRAVNWMKTSRHCAAATKVATTWEAKWNKLRKSAMEAVLYFIELGEKSDKRHEMELAESKAALAKAHAAERIAVEERKNLTKRLADTEATATRMETSLRNAEHSADATSKEQEETIATFRRRWNNAEAMIERLECERDEYRHAWLATIEQAIEVGKVGLMLHAANYEQQQRKDELRHEISMLECEHAEAIIKTTP